MKDRKTEFKWFTITQYKEEEKYLSKMNSKGWRFVGVNLPGFYHFEKCQPENVTYKLDYNQEGIKNKSEYVQMFSDCGWDHVLDFVGYSYFRKVGENTAADEDIFCDDESRLDMMKRVFRGRIIPLIILFFCVIIPQFLENGFAERQSTIQKVLTTVMFIMGIVYLASFAHFTKDCHTFEKGLRDEDSIRVKYYAIYALEMLGLIIFLAIGGLLVHNAIL